jgi:molybdenum cofactor cytidylyltransferase
VVVGGGGDAVERSLHPARASIARNDAYGSGCAGSLLAGLGAAGDCRAVVLLLGDMPGVDAGVIDTVLASWTADPSWAAVTSYRGDLGHPFVFADEAFPTLRALHGDKAVWKLVDGGQARPIGIDRPLPFDVDTWADYDAVRAQLQIVT